MAFDVVSLLISIGSVFGIFSILSVSLNLEYGYAGQPNFGQVLFYGFGAFSAAMVAANLLPILGGQLIGDVCTSESLIAREAIALSHPVFSIATWLVALAVATGVAALIGYFSSYPALRVKEEWYLSMILLVAAEIFRVVVRNTPQFGCGFNGLAGITNPFEWINVSSTRLYIGDTDLAVYVSSGIYAAIILAMAFSCYYLAQKLVNSPYGRLLKSVRDDKVASATLGKDVNRARIQIMIIGSAMAGLAGALYVFYIGVAISEDYISAVTFSIWVMIVLGGFANNKGALVGTLVLIGLERGTLLLGIILQGSFSSFDPNLVNYARYLVEAVLLLTLLMYRPRGLVPETPVKTNAYEVFLWGKADSRKT